MTAIPHEPSSPSLAAELADSRPRTLWRDAWSRLRRKPAAMVAGVIVILYVLIALSTFVPRLYEHTGSNSEREGLIWKRVSKNEYQPPTLSHPSTWLGTDILGRSVMWRTLYGTRMAMTIALWAGLISVTLGIFFGVLAGYFPGLVDDLITWLFTTISTVPWVLLVIATTFALKGRLSDLTAVILALGLTDWVGLCRLIRGEVMGLRDRDYITAARALGLSHIRVIFRHILPNVFHLVIIQFSLGAIMYVQAEVVLSFIGLGISEKPSWGRMIDDAKLELLRGVWWQVTAATAAIFILCLALNILGDALRDALDPRLRGTD